MEHYTTYPDSNGNRVHEQWIVLMLNWYHMHNVVSVCPIAFVDMNSWIVYDDVYVVDVIMVVS